MLDKVIALLGVLGALAPLAFAEPLVIEREITLKAQAQVFSQTACLNDFVEDSWIQGRCALDKAACCRWSLDGERSKTLNRAEIAKELAKINWGGFTLALKGAEQTVVTQSGRELKPSEIQAKIAATVAAHFGQSERDVGITGLKLMAPMTIEFGNESDWDVVLPEPLVDHATIKIISAREPSRALGWVQAVVSLKAEVFVAKHAVHPTDQIKIEDFELRKTNVLPLQQLGIALFRSDQFPVGVRARQSVMTGAALTAASVEKVPMVKFGDSVTLILKTDNLKISTKGVVQSSAAIGDMVTVQLQRYNRTFRGRLVDGRLVEVWL